MKPEFCEAAGTKSEGKPRVSIPAGGFRRFWKLYLFLFASSIAFNGLQVALTRIHPHGQTIFPEGNSIRTLKAVFEGRFADDCLGPIQAVVKSLDESPQASPYERVFFEQHIKFIYPLTSILPFYYLHRAGLGFSDIANVFRVICYASFVGIGIFSFLIASRSCRAKRHMGCVNGESVGAALAIAWGLLTFYPIVRGVDLGQMQTLLTLLTCTALYCWHVGKTGNAGLMIGLMVLVKPQYILLLGWALLRRKCRAFAYGLIPIVAGFGISFAAFGVQSNMDYFRLLSSIGRHGESFMANHSMNGLLNRQFFPSAAPHWDPNVYVPYHPAVYYGTVLSSLALVAFGAFYLWKKKQKGGLNDLACFALVTTMASPIAWEHHYGLLFPIFVYLWFSREWVKKSDLAVLGCAYFLTSNYFATLHGLAETPLLNVVLSYVYFGAFLVLYQLTRTGEEREPGVEAATTQASA
ncbi:MAG: glycosyltransferase family 87 protein [Terracidiphilus sp.]|nr:glycosyltransferase family 87 protein [Terracidiphilus sp.]